MKYKSLLFAAFAAAAVAFTGCNSSNDGPDSPQGRSYIDIMTIDAKNADGTVFTFQKENDSPLITLTTNQPMQSSVFTVGKRVVVNYIPTSGKQYESGSISVLQAMLTEGAGDEPEAKTALETQSWTSDAVAMYQAWRTGPYLNIIFNGITSSAGPKTCAVYVDKESVGTGIPTVYLIFDGSEGPNVNSYFFYASYDISKLWDAETTQAIRLVYAEQNAGRRTVEFIKPLNGDQPAVRP